MSDTRTDDWTGEQFEGEGIILTTTGGRQIIAEKSLRGPLGQVETLARLVDDLSARVAELEGAGGDGTTTARTATTTRKTTAK